MYFHGAVLNNLYMKQQILLLAFSVFSIFSIQAQTPPHYYHIPANAGVNNSFFHPSLSGKMVFIYTQSELATAGITGASGLSSLWFRHNQAMSGTLSNFEITIGHTTLSAPVSTFANNFNTGTPTVTLSSNSYNYSSVAGTWNVPANGWTEIPLNTPFSYNGTDNIAIQITFTASTLYVPFYADNGGVPITQMANSATATSATSTTARPMLGLSPPPSTAPPVVSYSASDSLVCQGNCISFTDLSTQFPTSWSWTFPGSVVGSSTVQHPDSVCYNVPGTYDVKLAASNSFGSDSLTIPGMIIVKAASQAAIQVADDTVCAGDSVALVNTSTPGAVSNEWFMNGSSVSNSLNYTLNPAQEGNTLIQLVVESNIDCIDTASILIHVDSLPPISANASDSILCYGEAVTFSANPIVDFTWQIDGSNIATAPFAVETFNTPGVFQPTLIATEGACSDTIQLPMVHVGDDPLPDFQLNDVEFCISDTLHATNTSASNASAFKWRINGSLVSIATDLSTVLPGLGNHTIRLTATDFGCTDSTEQSVMAESEPLAIFTASATGQAWQVSFTDQSIDAASHSWDFGDGNTSTNANPTHTYASGGSYAVCLTVTNDAGCAHTTCETVEAPVGLEDPMMEQSIRCYPNPFSDQLFLELLYRGSVTATWNDLTGRIIGTQQLSASTGVQALDVSFLPDGMYFLRVQSDSGQTTVMKVVKE